MANSLIFINATDVEFPAPSALARGVSGPPRSTIFLIFPIMIFRFATAGRPMTNSNPFSPMAISMLRLFGNEARQSQRAAHLHMVRAVTV
jgi:hypothetical protein